MKNHLKKIVIVVMSLAVLVLAASFIYAKFVNTSDAEFDSNDVRDRLTTTTASGATDSTPASASSDGVDGSWVIADGSEVGYRVEENINGFDTTANGRTNVITGEFTIVGTQVTVGDFTVDMTTVSSDESRRDNQFNGRVMSVDTFPTATFALTEPISFGEVPADGSTITATATGDLTLRGVTKSVTFEVEATFESGRIGVFGQIPVVFADFGIPNPSRATITTEDHGLLEFVLIFDRA
ncbi:MAG: YceI family protein [Actinobacteria bacterium]|nr:YceI family protein [Actinomycetota bacterium]